MVNRRIERGPRPSAPDGATAEGATLTLITDGVLEARNREGELYGFERVAALMRKRPSAEQVAEAACSFGQEDDITVLSVKREVIREPSRVNGLRTVGA